MLGVIFIATVIFLLSSNNVICLIYIYVCVEFIKKLYIYVYNITFIIY